VSYKIGEGGYDFERFAEFSRGVAGEDSTDFGIHFNDLVWEFGAECVINPGIIADTTASSSANCNIAITIFDQSMQIRELNPSYRELKTQYV